MFPCELGGTIGTGNILSYESSFFRAFSGTDILGSDLLFFVISRPLFNKRVASDAYSRVKEELAGVFCTDSLPSQNFFDTNGCPNLVRIFWDKTSNIKKIR